MDCKPSMSSEARSCLDECGSNCMDSRCLFWFTHRRNWGSHNVLRLCWDSFRNYPIANHSTTSMAQCLGGVILPLNSFCSLDWTWAMWCGSWFISFKNTVMLRKCVWTCSIWRLIDSKCLNLGTQLNIVAL